MKYLSVDIETTGLDESFCQVLEVGCVMADTLDFDTPVEDLPTFRCRFYYDRVVGQPYALWLNAKLILDMEKRPAGFGYIHPDSFWSAFTDWIRMEQRKTTLSGVDLPKLSFSGKNFGTFDSRFLWKLPRWDREYFKSRVLDPGQFFFLPDDTVMPDLKTCIARAGVAWDESKHHDAIEDARVVVALNRVGLGQQWRDLTRPTSDARAVGQNEIFGAAYGKE